MRKYFLLTLALCAVISCVSAQNIPVEKARKVAKNMYVERSGINGIVPGDIAITSEYIISQDFSPVLYVFNIGNNKGFVIVSADARTVPVLSYSFEGSYSEYDQPENFKIWMNTYKQQIAWARDNDLQQSYEAAALWTRYSAESIEVAKGAKSVAPLLGGIAWDQGCYYNLKCPTATMSGYCNRNPTGCVATAMAMIMKYHNWPTKGYGTHSYAHTIANGYAHDYGTLTAPCGTTTYAWASMPNELSTSSTTAEKTAVSTLIYHCGVTVNTNYDVNGSGASFPNCQDAFTYHFIYNANYDVKAYHTDSEWLTLLKANLDVARPILYAGSDPGGGDGHCFVIDGYQGSGNDYFHFNWGWSGMYNSYNYLTAITPGGVGTGGGNGDFTADQQAILNIYPASPTVPVANFSANKTNIVPGDYIIFSNQTTGGLDYLWTVTPNTGLTWLSSTIPQSIAPRIRFSTPGTYTISLKATNSAGTNTKTRTNYIQVGPVGIQDTPLSQKISIGPNPSAGLFRINTGAADATGMKIEVYNLTGQKQSGYAVTDVSNGIFNADLSDLPSGMYCVVFTCSEGHAVKNIQIIR